MDYGASLHDFSTDRTTETYHFSYFAKVRNIWKMAKFANMDSFSKRYHLSLIKSCPAASIAKMSYRLQKRIAGNHAVEHCSPLSYYLILLKNIRLKELLSVFALFLFLLIKLPAVDQVVPDTVETSGNGSDRCQESVTQPDGKYGVLLP